MGEKRSQSKPGFLIASWVSHAESETARRLGHYFQYARKHRKIQLYLKNKKTKTKEYFSSLS